MFRLYARRRSWPRSGRTAECGPDNIKRVVIVNLLPSLGDTVAYLTIADVLSETHPEIEISWIADASMSSIVRLHPAIKQVHPVSIPNTWHRRIRVLRIYHRLWSVMRCIRRLQLEQSFDLAIVPRGGVDPSFSAHAVWMLNLPRSVGYSHSVEPEDTDHMGGDCLLTDVVSQVTESHEAMRALHLLEVAGLVADTKKYWDQQHPIRGVQRIAEKLNLAEIMAKVDVQPTACFVVVAPGAGVPKRMWPAKHFREICRRFAEQTPFTVLLSGSDAEVKLCQQIASGLGERIKVSAGILSVPEIVTLLSRSKLFVGNDSGPGHIAGALGIPTISLHIQSRSLDRHNIRPPSQSRPAGPCVNVLEPDDPLQPQSDQQSTSLRYCEYDIKVDKVWNEITKLLGSGA
jgi:ADP-heptose:LPS heptosyltransferase